jgi:arylsulfatase K
MARIDQDGIRVPPQDRPDHPALNYRRIVHDWAPGDSDEVIHQTRAVYAAMIAEVDDMVGAVLDALEQTGLQDSTYVIFSSDHGEMAMEHGFRTKMLMYEGSVRVPLIIAGPGADSGKEVDWPVALIDLYPTFADLGGMPKPAYLDGQSLLPELGGHLGHRRSWVLSQCHATTCLTGLFMLRQGPWKYVAYAGYEPQLFNLEQDPDECDNLVTDKVDVARAMDEHLRRIVDYSMVDAQVKAYDKRCFRRWRLEQKSAGTYEESMAEIYSGYDNVGAGQVQPWTEGDEAQIVAWLSS